MFELPPNFLSIGVIVAVLQLLFFTISEALSLDPDDGRLHKHFSSISLFIFFSDFANLLFPKVSHVFQ
jgi:hypothetical protein